MSVTPSCPILVIHDDDAFRKSLIAALDEKHFTVTFAVDGEEAVGLLQERIYNVIVVGLDLTSRRGAAVLEFLGAHRQGAKCGVLILGEPNPALRTFAPWVDETLMKPVDAGYVADRARAYCHC
jgi:DNA-binding response OmpR family regulator